jgi:2-polyprenyl-6-methoxyphenol hydroxylase-like FAD-dependent oxidoreductase
VTHEAIRCTFRTIRHNREGVHVQFTGGRKCRRDLVSGADSLNAKVRDVLLPNGKIVRNCGIAGIVLKETKTQAQHVGGTHGFELPSA